MESKPSSPDENCTEKLPDGIVEGVVDIWNRKPGRIAVYIYFICFYKKFSSKGGGGGGGGEGGGAQNPQDSINNTSSRKLELQWHVYLFTEIPVFPDSMMSH